MFIKYRIFTILFPKCIQTQNEHCTFKNVVENLILCVEQFFAIKSKKKYFV